MNQAVDLDEMQLFRDMARRAFEKEISPHYEQWEEDHIVPRSLWNTLGSAGLLCPDVAEEYGGAGTSPHVTLAMIEELSYMGFGGFASGYGIHSNIIAPYLSRHGSPEQKAHWLPRMVTGECVGALAMTEPGAGSDVQGIRTTAVRDGDEWVLNGSKIFITNGIVGDLIVLVTKTDPALKAKGVSLFLVDTSLPGYRKSRNMKKLGNKAQDTAELFFDNVRVPASSMLGEEHGGWKVLMSELVQERILVAVRAASTCEAALEATIRYVKDRKAFGQPVFDFQNTRFQLANCATKTQALRIFTDRCIELHTRGELDMHTAAMAKLYSTEVQDEVLDACLQLHGGNGYMWEYPIARMWADARVHRIYAGTNEIMREIIGRAL